MLWVSPIIGEPAVQVDLGHRAELDAVAQAVLAMGHRVLVLDNQANHRAWGSARQEAMGLVHRAKRASHLC
jgi:hypothetical protein